MENNNILTDEPINRENKILLHKSSSKNIQPSKEPSEFNILPENKPTSELETNVVVKIPDQEIVKIEQHPVNINSKPTFGKKPFGNKRNKFNDRKQQKASDFYINSPDKNKNQINSNDNIVKNNENINIKNDNNELHIDDN